MKNFGSFLYSLAKILGGIYIEFWEVFVWPDDLTFISLKVKTNRKTGEHKGYFSLFAAISGHIVPVAIINKNEIT